MTAPGFRVDTELIRKAATRMALGGEFAGAARKSVGSATVPAAAFGASTQGQQLASAVAAAIEASSERIGTRCDQLIQLADKLATAADGYDRVDATNTGEVQRWR